MSRLWAKITAKNRKDENLAEHVLPLQDGGSMPTTGGSTPRTHSPTPATNFPESTNAEGPTLTPDVSVTASEPINMASAPSLQVRLWNEAYDALKETEPKLMDAYERILSLKLLGNQESQDTAAEGANQISESQDARCHQMAKLVRSELKRIEKVVSLKAKAGQGLDIINTVKGTVNTALQSAPQAAVAWAGVCAGLEILTNPISESKSNRAGVEYVLMRMDWYWNLVLLLLDENLQDQPTAKVQHEVERAISQMYQKVLLYQAKSVYTYHRHWLIGIGIDVLKLDDWDGKLKDVKDAEGTVDRVAAQYNSEVIKLHMKGILKSAQSQEEELRKLLEAIHDHSESQSAQLENIYTTVQQGALQTERRALDDKEEECLQALGDIDPVDDKRRIEEGKGGLLRDSYIWVTEHASFQQLVSNQSNQVLWIKGDPGKGKTMLMCGIIDELGKSPNYRLSYFFCQQVNSQSNNPAAVLRGLIYLLASQDPSLLVYVQRRYKKRGIKMFESDDVFVSLKEIFLEMINSPDWKSTIIMVDAIDECVTDRPRLLDFIKQTSELGTPSNEAYIKWIITSRNWTDIEEALQLAEHTTRLQLELNQELVSNAIGIYIAHKVDQLAKIKKYDNDTKLQVIEYLNQHANGTFLWVALVCQSLRSVLRPRTLTTLKTYPAGLDTFYMRMVKDMEETEEADICNDIVRTAAIVYRPVSLQELKALLTSLEGFEISDIENIIGYCGSFLTLREKYVYFIHQSANDFWLNDDNKSITFPSGLGQQHYGIFCQSITLLNKWLKRDLYDLGWPGTKMKEIEKPEPDPLEPISYSSSHWADHLEQAQSAASLDDNTDLLEGGIVDKFLRQSFLFWIESLCLDGKVANGLKALSKLEKLMGDMDENSSTLLFVNDAQRFLRHFRFGIEQLPLQIYASGLIFSPEQSIVRKTFAHLKYNWISLLSPTEQYWDACIDILVGHKAAITTIVCFPKGKFASSSHDGTIKVWDADGNCLHTLEDCHTNSAYCITLSEDGRRLMSLSFDNSMAEWDLPTGKCFNYVEFHGTAFYRVPKHNQETCVCSPDEDTVIIMEQATKKSIQVLHCTKQLACVVYLPISGRFAFFASGDACITVAKSEDDASLKKLECPGKVSIIAPNRTGEILASGHVERKRRLDWSINIWALDTGSRICTFSGHEGMVLSLDFSPNSEHLVSGSQDRTVRVWHLASKTCIHIFKGFLDRVTSVGYSLDGKRVIAGSADRSIRVWDVATTSHTSSLDCHTDHILNIAMSNDGSRLVSASEDCTLKIWDTSNGRCINTLQDQHTDGFVAVSFSHDDQKIVTGDSDGIIKLWDVATVTCIKTLTGHKHGICSVALSSNLQLVVSASLGGSIRIWDLGTGRSRKVDMEETVTGVIFAPDNKKIVSGHVGYAKVWDVVSNELLQSLQVQKRRMVEDNKFSFDGSKLITAVFRGMVKIWDSQSYICLHTLEQFPGCISRVAVWLDKQATANALKEQLSNAAVSDIPSHTTASDRDPFITQDGRIVLFVPLFYSTKTMFEESDACLALALRSHRVIFLSIRPTNQ